MNAAEKSDARNRVQSKNSIAMTLYFQECSNNGIPDSAEKIKDLIEKCLLNAEIVDDVLYAQMEPLL